ncbi:nuclear transport factor 2 family protein [Facklamia miroungae]|uniref:Predicted SnoaL-like aldol condensation-catalyzing enzyme n=1 Tax=Facklamia miroungae TaxID=120956 RepID=A0A1G7QCG0_9LACT|nr:ester cyclase [Facklamia miroungae]NKZ28882.1 SnoaL-like domain-containing protein [Facklamia miroungae]SDF95609.1 Predicted SnoaL-like aldol condensation-catalyzing enzyme [Facklamia miroungae]
MTPDLKRNKRNAVNFYKTAYMGDPEKAVSDFVGKEYIQHNPSVENGKEGFIKYFKQMVLEFPSKQIEFVRVIAEDNLVSLHTHQIWPDDIEYVTMDFFRFDSKGKIVEHWDSIQEIPKDSKSGNLMY